MAYIIVSSFATKSASSWRRLSVVMGKKAIEGKGSRGRARNQEGHGWKGMSIKKKVARVEVHKLSRAEQVPTSYWGA